MTTSPPTIDPRPRPVEADELDAVVALIAGAQARPEQMSTYLGDQPEGIRAELDELQPPWAGTVRVAVDRSASLVGASLVDWDEEVGRAWIHGPWVVGGDHEWARWARPLAEAAMAQAPAAVGRFELAGTVANVRLAELAAALGWTPTEVNHALVVDRSGVAAWPSAPSAGGERPIRPATADDVGTLRPLHDAEFPASYATLDQLVSRSSTGGDVLTLVAEAPGTGVAGYAAGRVQADGEGYVDFIAVQPGARGSGVGRRLLVALARELVERSTTGRVSLTVQDGRVAARRLYESLGFRTELSFLGYRSPDPAGDTPS